MAKGRSPSIGGDDRGAILVYAAFAVLGLIAFATLVVDYGVLWSARRQAQNVADSAALAGAIALAYEDKPVSGVTSAGAVTSALATSQSNRIWGEAPGAGVVAADVSFPLSPAGCALGSNLGGIFAWYCVRVNVIRSAQRGNALPSIFGILLGLSGQDVRATAVAQSMPANASNCVRPFAVPDLYTEKAGGADTFDPGDEYFNAGYTSFHSFGETSSGSPLITHYSVTKVDPGAFRFYDETAMGSSPGATAIQRSIRACSDVVRRVGDNLTSNMIVDPGFEAELTLALKAGIDDLIALDPNASWNGQRIVGSCVLTHTCKQYNATGDQVIDDLAATVSPRVVILPIFNPSHTTDTTVVNFAAFFITQFNLATSEVDGVFVSHPGRIDPSAPQLLPDVAFLRTVQLVR